jgi:phosphoglucosamine mutase
MSTLDGVRLDFDEGWFLVRKSGTEPKIRITAEAKDQKTTQSLYDRVSVVVQRHV